MATLYISEYDRQARDPRAIVPTGQEPAIATQTITISGVSAQSAAFNAKTTFIRVHTDAICSLVFGASPTATTSGARMAANQTEFFGVVGGGKLAVITNT
jgi:hypothetical protein